MNFSHATCLAVIRVIGLIAFVPTALAQTNGSPVVDLNALAANTLLTVPVDDYSISGLVTHLPEAKDFRYGIVLFPGYPSIMKLREEAGRIRFDLGGNFLIRSRRHWLDEETLVISVDAPSDQWATFRQQFRQTRRYGADVAALLAEASHRYGIKDWTLVGTSEGTVSAFHTARMNPAIVTRLILSSSTFVSSGNGPGISGVDWKEIQAKLLWVHHENDGCQYTPYRDAQRHAEMTRSPLITVRGGGPARGSPCEAFSQHGFVGIELDTVQAMRVWVKTGKAPTEVVRP